MSDGIKRMLGSGWGRYPGATGAPDENLSRNQIPRLQSVSPSRPLASCPRLPIAKAQAAPLPLGAKRSGHACFRGGNLQGHNSVEGKTCIDRIPASKDASLRSRRRICTKAADPGKINLRTRLSWLCHLVLIWSRRVTNPKKETMRTPSWAKQTK